jgi:DNA polymerase
MQNAGDVSGISVNENGSGAAEAKEDKLKKWTDNVRNCHSLCVGLISPTRPFENPVDFRLATAPTNNLWSLWQGNLNAEVMVVGQDWGDMCLYHKCCVSGSFDPLEDKSTTNMHLSKLLSTMGIVIDRRSDPQSQPCYFANAVLCIRNKGMQGDPLEGSLKDWSANCGPHLKELIGIIEPKVVIALGESPFRSILDQFFGKDVAREKISSIRKANPVAKGSFQQIVTYKSPTIILVLSHFEWVNGISRDMGRSPATRNIIVSR